MYPEDCTTINDKHESTGPLETENKNKNENVTQLENIEQKLKN